MTIDVVAQNTTNICSVCASRVCSVRPIYGGFPKTHLPGQGCTPHVCVVPGEASRGGLCAGGFQAREDDREEVGHTLGHPTRFGDGDNQHAASS